MFTSLLHTVYSKFTQGAAPNGYKCKLLLLMLARKAIMSKCADLWCLR